MQTAAFREALKDWARSHRQAIISVIVLLVLGFAAGAVLATDKPKPAPVVVQPPHENRCLDKWKCDHFIGSGVLGVAAGRSIDEANRWRWADQTLNCGVTCQRWSACLAPGIAKELHDQYRWKSGSWKDMTANVLGCALGLHLSKEF